MGITNNLGLKKRTNQEEIYDRLSTWVKVIQKALIATAVVEGVFVIVIGVASNKISNTFDIWAKILLFCTIFYLLLIVIRTLYQKNFPGDILEELHAKSKLDDYEKSFSRQKIINEYINQSVKSLNDHTCSIDISCDPDLCDEDLQVRLKDILKPVLTNTNVILDTYDVNQFTIGLYLDDYYTIEPTTEFKNQFINNQSEKGILILRDDFDFQNNLIDKRLLEGMNETQQRLHIQSAIQKSFNNIEFDQSEFTHNDKTYTIICSDIPMVCSDTYASGVMFIILEGQYSTVENLSYLLRIFNRLAANYVYKYNDCVYDLISNWKVNENLSFKNVS